MGVWDVYENRINAHGGNKRGASKKHEVHILNKMTSDNLSYHSVRIYDKEYGYNITERRAIDGSYEQNVSIINSDNLDEKTLCTLPGDDMPEGALIEWMNNYWIVTERDANTTLYTRVKLKQCNYLLKWITEDDQIIEQWCVVEDGTKYMSGELEDRDFIATRGDSRISVIVAKNNVTCKLGRENRFLVDDPNTSVPLAYILSKPLKVGMYHNDNGVYKFILQEVTGTGDDNKELMIADYYKHFPKYAEIPEDLDNYNEYYTESEETTGKKVWL